MRIKTEILKDLVSKSIKGASNNKMIPLTGFMGIEVDGKKLVLTTTDGNNILLVASQALDIEGDFYTVVNAELFAKLVGKLTTEEVELVVNNDFLEVRSNGVYKLDIPLDSEGNHIVFDKSKFLQDYPESREVDAKKLKEALSVAKVAVADSMEDTVLTGYYFGKDIITTNREKVCFIDSNLFNDDILFSYETGELLQLFADGNITFYRKGQNFVFEDSQITLYGTELEGKDRYPVSVIENLVKTAYTSSITFDKTTLLDMLDRMSLFIADYDKNGVFLNIWQKELKVTSQKSNASEILQCEAINNTDKEFTCLVDIDMLKTELQAAVSDKITLYYGDDSSIKLDDSKNIMILSLIQQEN